MRLVHVRVYPAELDGSWLQATDSTQLIPSRPCSKIIFRSSSARCWRAALADAPAGQSEEEEPSSAFSRMLPRHFQATAPWHRRSPGPGVEAENIVDGKKRLIGLRFDQRRAFAQPHKRRTAKGPAKFLGQTFGIAAAASNAAAAVRSTRETPGAFLGESPRATP